MNPLIGIPCRHDPDKHTFYLHRAYSEAVREAGGTPLMIPLLTGSDYLRHVAGLFDGILLPGSDSDVDPARYGQTPHPQIGRLDAERDAVDWFLLQHSFDRKTPLLGICYGLQALNVFLGGSLVQDIASERQTELQHSGKDRRHPVVCSEGTPLRELAGAERVEVNSSHHQSLDRVAESLEVLARAPDGVIEAVRLPSNDHFVLGVQWHPERGYSQDGFSQRIFDAFIRASGK
ncbi:MAG: gamma-glutamyl-gamma-aminobutyrate hydrolase family protein [Acidobacteriota bacterium]